MIDIALFRKEGILLLMLPLVPSFDNSLISISYALDCEGTPSHKIVRSIIPNIVVYTHYSFRADDRHILSPF